MTAKTKSKRIFYFDALRAMAILCVVFIHVIGFIPKLVHFTTPMFYTPFGFWELFANNSFRIGVDLFLMLSGALSLGRDWEIKDFLGKRLPRIIKPFVFWAIVGSLIMVVLSYFFVQIKFVTNFSPLSILTAIYHTFMFESPSFGHYWFFWMILGTYFIMPIINRWLYHSKLKEAEYFLVLWVINTIFDYTLMIDCPVKLSYFTSPIGLVVLGYYLRHTKREIFNHKLVAILMIIIPMFLMVYYSYDVLGTEQFFKFNRYSILMIIEVTGVFCLFKCSQRLKNPNEYFRRFITAVASCSYGMYLTHCIFVHFLGKLAHKSILSMPEIYILLMLSAFFGSLSLIYILKEIPFLQDYIGVK